MICLNKICRVQIQPGKHLLHHAGHTAPTRKHELHPTRVRNASSLEHLDHEVGIGDLPNVCLILSSFLGMFMGDQCRNSSCALSDGNTIITSITVVTLECLMLHSRHAVIRHLNDIWRAVDGWIDWWVQTANLHTCIIRTTNNHSLIRQQNRMSVVGR